MFLFISTSHISFYLNTGTKTLSCKYKDIVFVRFWNVCLFCPHCWGNGRMCRQLITTVVTVQTQRVTWRRISHGQKKGKKTSAHKGLRVFSMVMLSLRECWTNTFPSAHKTHKGVVWAAWRSLRLGMFSHRGQDGAGKPGEAGNTGFTFPFVAFECF